MLFSMMYGRTQALVVTSGDGSLSVHDLRAGKAKWVLDCICAVCMKHQLFSLCLCRPYVKDDTHWDQPCWILKTLCLMSPLPKHCPPPHLEELEARRMPMTSCWPWHWWVRLGVRKYLAGWHSKGRTLCVLWHVHQVVMCTHIAPHPPLNPHSNLLGRLVGSRFVAGPRWWQALGAACSPSIAGAILPTAATGALAEGQGPPRHPAPGVAAHAWLRNKTVPVAIQPFVKRLHGLLA
jgi:hypothetical protein